MTGGPPPLAIGAALALAAFAAAVAYAVSDLAAFRSGGPHTFTTAALEKIAAKQNPLLLVVVGEVYDVTKGREFYGRAANGDAESYTRAQMPQ